MRLEAEVHNSEAVTSKLRKQLRNTKIEKLYYLVCLDFKLGKVELFVKY